MSWECPAGWDTSGVEEWGVLLVEPCGKGFFGGAPSPRRTKNCPRDPLAATAGQSYSATRTMAAFSQRSAMKGPKGKTAAIMQSPATLGSMGTRFTARKS